MPAAADAPRLVPPGRRRNPSAWRERIPIVIAALAGFVIASYLALYQLGIVPQPWEPFFGDGSRRVLHSIVARLLPVPDAALGAGAYVVDVVGGIIGGVDRWRATPWLVVAYGIAVALFGVVSLALVIAQPLVAHGWCTLCLVSAAISIGLVWPGTSELRAVMARRSAEVHGHRLE